jgi:hypothetical protein
MYQGLDSGGGTKHVFFGNQKSKKFNQKSKFARRGR